MHTQILYTVYFLGKKKIFQKSSLLYIVYHVKKEKMSRLQDLNYTVISYLE